MRWSCSAVLLSLCALLLSALPAYAQPGIRPGDERLESPEFEPETPSPAPLELPPLPEPAAANRDTFSAGLRVFVRAFQIEDSTVFSEEELASLTEPYLGREIRSEELFALRDRITTHYVEHGYVTSGAVIPDQSIEDGLVRIQVIEGVLADVDVEGTQRFRSGYFRDRLMRAGGTPVNVLRIEQQLQSFQQDPLVERIRARLVPGEARGQSHLSVEVEEARTYALEASFSNEEPPSIGELAGEFTGSLANLIGHADSLDARFVLTEGLRDYDTRYELPLNRSDTLLGLGFRYSASEVVEEPFDFLDIESEVLTAGVWLRQPLYRAEGVRIDAGIRGEWREAQSEAKGFILGTLCFDEGTGSCRKKVAVLRPFAQWTWRTRDYVIAARSQLSFGIDALGSTVVGNSDVPDSEFVAWLVQAQWAQRLPGWLLDGELLARVDSQLSSRPLLSLEKFAIGGRATVRGYRENELVRDNGVIASLELRIPVWRSALGRPIVRVGPFFDWGSGWNDDENSFESELMSVGVGVHVAPREWLLGELYWGERLRDVSNPHNSIQDEGISFRVTVIAF